MSNISILTGGSDIYEPLVFKIKEKVGVSEVRSISTNTTKEELSRLACDEPFFSDKFVVEVITDGFDIREFKSLLYQLKTFNNSMFVFLNSKKELHELCLEIFVQNEIKELNCYKPPYMLLELYLKTYGAKKYTLDAVSMMYKLLAGQWNMLNTYVSEFEQMDKSIIDVSTVSSTIPKYVGINLNNTLKKILTGDRLDYDIKLLYNYKYASKYILTGLLGRLIKIINYKKDYMSGHLRLSNIHEYAKEAKVQPKMLEDIMENILTKVSTETLYYYRYLIRKNIANSDGLLLLLMEVRNNEIK